MKVFALISLLVVVASASLLEEHALQFQSFKLKHGKTYKTPVEETTRFAIFKDNLRSIEEHNALYEQGLVSFKKGVNQFSDLTQEEFTALLKLHSKPALNNTIKYVKTGASVPDSIDWRTKGQVSEVKNQGTCGSCWAFSITGSTEAAYYRKHKKLVTLSEQQLVDCATEANMGCNGGFLDKTFPYVEKYGLQSEESYAYTGRDASCKYNQSKVVTKVDNYVSIAKDEDALLEAVGTIGPVSVAIDASFLSFYKFGVFSFWLCSKSLNHGVLVVGYGEENGQKYWIIKNSWGPTWGENGYFRLARGKNECGVAEDNTYPIIN